MMMKYLFLAIPTLVGSSYTQSESPRSRLSLREPRRKLAIFEGQSECTVSVYNQCNGHQLPQRVQTYGFAWEPQLDRSDIALGFWGQMGGIHVKGAAHCKVTIKKEVCTTVTKVYTPTTSIQYLCGTGFNDKVTGVKFGF